jgi:acyl carrier protein
MASSTVQRLVEIIREVARIRQEEPLDESTPMVGAGIALDSASVLELLLALEKEFCVMVHADELLEADALQNIGTLAAFVDSKVARAE